MNDQEIKNYEKKVKRLNDLKSDIVHCFGYFQVIGSYLNELEALDIESARRLRAQVIRCFNSDTDFDEKEALELQKAEKEDYENSIVLKRMSYSEKER